MVSLRRAVPPQYTLLSSDEALLVDTTNGSVNLVLPTVGTLGERLIPITIIGSNDVTVQCSGADTVDGLGTLALPRVSPAHYLLVTDSATTWTCAFLSRQTYAQASEQNEVDLVSAPPSNAPIVRPRSPNADIDLWLFGKGTGKVYVNGSVAIAAGDVATTATADKIVKALGTGKISSTWMDEVLALSNLSDVTGVTGTTGVVVLQDSPTLETPTLNQPDIADFNAAQHTHQDGANAGVLSHLALLTATLVERVMARAGRVFSWYRDVGTAGWIAVGTAITQVQVGTATSSNLDEDSTTWEQHITGATSGNTGGRESSAAFVRRSWGAIITQRYRLGPNIQNCRHWIGVSDADLTGVDALTTQNAAAWRFSTGAGDGTAGAGSTPVFAVTTCDGSGTPTTTITAIAAVNNTTKPEGYIFKTLLLPSSTSFYVDLNDGNGFQFVATHTTKLPGNAVMMKTRRTVTTLTTAGKRNGLGKEAVAFN